MSDYYLLITDAGKALEAAAHASGEPVNLTNFAVGDGGGANVTPEASQTALVGETFRDAISSLTVSPTDTAVLEAECIIPKSSGGYTIREIGILADDGTLYAVGNFAEQEKPAPDSGYAASLQIFADLVVSDTSDITLTVQDGSYLTETQANTIYLRQDKRLSEIAEQGADAQVEARENIGCGTAAAADKTTSHTDSTAGHLLQVGDFGIGGPEISIPDGTDIYKYFPTAKSGNYGGGGDFVNVAISGGWHGFKWQQHGGDSKYGFLLEMASNNRLALHIYNNATGDMTNPQNYWTNSGLMYSTGFKPTAADVGALPLTGGTLTGPLLVQSGASKHLKIYAQGTPSLNMNIELWGNTDRPTVLEFNDETSYHFYSQRNKDGSVIFDCAGQITPHDYGNFDARYQAKGSYYTTSQSDDRYIGDIHFGASTSHSVSNNQSFSSAGYALTGFMSDGSNDDIDTLYAKPVQKLNRKTGVWTTIAG
jgi:phage-related tail fiber protein